MNTDELLKTLDYSREQSKPPHRAWLWICNGLMGAATVSFWWLSDQLSGQAHILALFISWFSMLGAYGINLHQQGRFLNGTLAMMKVDAMVTASMLKDLERLTDMNENLRKRLSEYESNSG